MGEPLEADELAWGDGRILGGRRASLGANNRQETPSQTRWKPKQHPRLSSDFACLRTPVPIHMNKAGLQRPLVEDSAFSWGAFLCSGNHPTAQG